MNKQECLDLLAEVEKKIKKNNWEGQVDEPNDTLCWDDMLGYLDGFGLPEAQEMDDSDCLILPVGWLEGVDKESPEYKEIANRYGEVYDYMRYECSREWDALTYMYAQEEADLHRDYWRSVL